MNTLTLTYWGTTVNFLTTYKVLRDSFVQGIVNDDGIAEDTFAVWVDSTADFDTLVETLNNANNAAVFAMRDTKVAHPYVTYRFDGESASRIADVLEVGMESPPEWRGNTGLTKGEVEVYIIRKVFEPVDPATSGTTLLRSDVEGDFKVGPSAAGDNPYFEFDLTSYSADSHAEVVLRVGDTTYGTASANLLNLLTGGTYTVATGDGISMVFGLLARRTASDLTSVEVFDFTDASGANSYSRTISSGDIKYYQGSWNVYAFVESPSACCRVRFKHGWSNTTWDSTGDWVTMDDTDGLDAFVYLGNYSFPAGSSQSDLYYGRASAGAYAAAYYMQVEYDEISTCTGANVNGFVLVPTDYANFSLIRLGTTVEQVNIDSDNEEVLLTDNVGGNFLPPSSNYRHIGDWPHLEPGMINRWYCVVVFYDATTGYHVIEPSALVVNWTANYNERYKYVR